MTFINYSLYLISMTLKDNTKLIDDIRRLALENALKFKGKANPKALVGGIIRLYPDAKSDMKSLMDSINALVAEVNVLSPDEQKKELLSLDPDFEKKQVLAKKERREQRSSLPDLPNAEMSKVVTRIPPEPSKYNHLGHAMSFLINYLYAKKYDGRAVLRFDDTNPEKETQEFVDAVHEDVINYLGIVPSEKIFASDHMNLYYSYAQQLIDEAKAYVCTCSQDDIKLGRREMKDCPHRDQSVEENNRLWLDMKEGKFDEGKAVLRLKINMQHKNAVMRDPVIYRLSYKPHYRQGTKFKVWPMYDFETAIEEGLCKVTHVLRSNEFDQRIELQNYIASLFGFPPVTYKHYGRYNVIGASTQGREIRALIESGQYIGWDDPRLVTLRALKRRGIIREAYYELAQKIGLSKTQTNLDFSVIAAVNRSLLDKSAKRFFAVKNPVVITVNKIPDSLKEFSLSYHPEAPKGERKLSCVKEYYVEKSDVDSLKEGVVVRLMDAMNIKKISGNIFEFVSESYEDYKFLNGSALIHFVPKDGDELKAEVLMPDTSLQSIICESNIGSLKPDAVIQFERFAFVRFDHVSKDGLIQFWFTHE